MKKTYEYRAYPTTKQRKLFTVWLALLRSVYNQALAWRIEAYQTAGLTVKWTTQANALPDLKQESESFACLHSDVLQDAMRRLDKAYKAFFRRVKRGDEPGFPRFKGEGRYRSMTFSHLAKRLIRDVHRRYARVVVPKVGHLKIRYHRPLPDGKIKTLTISKKASGWYATIVVEVPAPVEVPVNTTLGVDVGLNSFVVDSDGERIANPHHYMFVVRSETRGVGFPNPYCPDKSGCTTGGETPPLRFRFALCTFFVRAIFFIKFCGQNPAIKFICSAPQCARQIRFRYLIDIVSVPDQPPNRCYD